MADGWRNSISQVDAEVRQQMNIGWPQRVGTTRHHHHCGCSNWNARLVWHKMDDVLGGRG